MVPQLIPRDPVNNDGVKPGFNSIRSNIQTNETIDVEIDPTSNAPIAIFDGIESYFYYIFIFFSFITECDIHIPTNQKPGKFIEKNFYLNLFFIYLEESISIPITSLSSTYVPTTPPNFPRLTPYSTLRRSSSRTNV